MKRTKTKLLIETSLMVALATVLSVFKLVEMPYGGSVTMASMLPILIISYRCGIGWGLGGGLCYAVIEQLLGLKNLSYFTTWQSVVAIILLDYILAFTLIGLGGVFKSRRISQANSFFLGGMLVSILRYLCHVISGATVWAGLSIPDGAAIIYSFGYNATYMIPETVILLAAGYYIGSLIDFSKDVPLRATRYETHEGKKSGALALPIAFLLLALIIDVSLLAPYTQDPDSGMFDLGYLKNAPFITVAIVSAVCIALSTTIFILSKRKKAK